MHQAEQYVLEDYWYVYSEPNWSCWTTYVMEL